MPSAQEQYTREILTGLQYFATWLPILNLEVGQIGKIKKNAFTATDHLKKRKIPIGTVLSRPMGTLKYSSSGSVAIDFKLSGETPIAGSKLTKAEAGVTVGFSRDNAVVFEAAGCQVESLDDPAALSRAILKSHEEGEWDIDNWVITELIRVESATILISSGKDARIELRAKGKLDAIETLAALDGGLKIAASRSMGTEIIAAKGLTPLFRASRVRTSWLGGAAKFEARSLTGSGKGKEKDNIPTRASRPRAHFSPVSLDDLFAPPLAPTAAPTGKKSGR